MSLTIKQLSNVVRKVTYKDWIFRIFRKGSGFLVQPIFVGPDAETGKVAIQTCRKWYISSHACLAEIVRTMYMAVEAAEFHEFQERFKFNGKAIFSPHINPEGLAYFIGNSKISNSVRTKKGKK